MPKTFSIYYKAQGVRVQIAPTKPGDDRTTTDGRIFVGLRLSDEFTGDAAVRQALGWMDEQAYRQELLKSKEKPTTILFSIQSAAAKANLIKEITLTIIPDPDTTAIYPYGSRFNLMLTANASKNLQQVADDLYKTTFHVGSGRKTRYVVLDNSIREKNSRKTASRLGAGFATVDFVEIPGLELVDDNTAEEIKPKFSFPKGDRKE